METAAFFGAGLTAIFQLITGRLPTFGGGSRQLASERPGATEAVRPSRDEA